MQVWVDDVVGQGLTGPIKKGFSKGIPYGLTAESAPWNKPFNIEPINTGADACCPTCLQAVNKSAWLNQGGVVPSPCPESNCGPIGPTSCPTSSYVKDCNDNCVSMEDLKSDGVCDPRFNCRDFNYDVGDCEEGTLCPKGEIADCELNCIPQSDWDDSDDFETCKSWCNCALFNYCRNKCVPDSTNPSTQPSKGGTPVYILENPYLKIDDFTENNEKPILNLKYKKITISTENGIFSDCVPVIDTPGPDGRTISNLPDCIPE